MTKKKPKVFCLKTASQNEILSLLVFFMLLLSISNKSQGTQPLLSFSFSFTPLGMKVAFLGFFVLSHKLSLFFSLGLMGKTKAKIHSKSFRLVAIQSYFL